jgi:NO-binding membrane sensor protein with MHYT domain
MLPGGFNDWAEGASVQVDYFSYGILTPALSYALSVLGSLLALVCTARARRIADNGRRLRWLILAASALGGTGIWVMHFMAMLGFQVPGQSIQYDLALTAASLLIAIVVVLIGLMIVGFGRPNAIKIIVAGVLTGLGVAGMHYTGMAAMKMPAHVTYDSKVVAISIGIAVVAATVALWFTVTLRKPVAIGIAALIMGLAVNGMHYTAMYALKVSAFVATPVRGLPPNTFLVPIVVFVVATIAVLLFALLSRTGLDSGESDRTIMLATGAHPVVPRQATGEMNGESSAQSNAAARASSAAAFVNRRPR